MPPFLRSSNELLNVRRWRGNHNWTRLKTHVQPIDPPWRACVDGRLSKSAKGFPVLELGLISMIYFEMKRQFIMSEVIELTPKYPSAYLLPFHLLANKNRDLLWPRITVLITVHLTCSIYHKIEWNYGVFELDIRPYIHASYLRNMIIYIKDTMRLTLSSLREQRKQR